MLGLFNIMKKDIKPNPLTWWRFEGGTVRVVCSKGHKSELMHNIDSFGNLYVQTGQSPSCHCGVCNELLPSQLIGWSFGIKSS